MPRAEVGCAATKPGICPVSALCHGREGTEGYDRGAKFAHYRRLDTLQEYVLVDSRQRSVEVFSRRDEGWLLRAVPEDGVLGIESLDFRCGLDAVHEDVSFEPAAD